ncbi:MAG: methyltransferase domain-containing protein [Berryella intestinalis]|uniref:methyltransferase domain-containing protein n=1 Tax=Berryella intestinalis TaxID=1531429 RepID=UPI002A5881CF|nr:methyltransferase domain-containing protein [Berryella intestinalis]MDD7369896.1 methyltransferase domain-containing protein [Berryella intestinalis]MDY3128812.1 methyltransferase domain-containing protein [Berryella intestinalis]
MDTRARYSKATLGTYYGAIPHRNTASAACRMPFPKDGYSGKRVLDVNCRKGKGALAILDRVAPGGFVMGVDPDEGLIEAARAYALRSLGQAAETDGRIAFACAVPENLAEAGIEDESFDVVFANCSLNLSYDFDAVLREFARVLAADGAFVFDAVVATGKRDYAVWAPARVVGNEVQASYSRDGLTEALHRAGFSDVEYADEGLIDHRVGSGASSQSAAPGVPQIDSDEDVSFIRTVLTAHRR